MVFYIITFICIGKQKNIGDSMPRLKLKPLNNYSFSTDITVRTTDLNYGGHLGNDKLLSLVHEARVAFLAGHGFSERNCAGVSLIVGDIAIVYHSEAFVKDVLRFDVAAGELTRCGFRLFYRITRTSDNRLIALVENGVVCFDYKTHTTQPLPEAVEAVLR